MNPEKQTAEGAANICRNSVDAETFWRESIKALGFNAKDEGVFVITLDNERRLTGCHQIESRVFRSPILFADEVANLKALEGIEEFIVIHNRPGLSPNPVPDDKNRAREIALAAQRKDSALLDYIILGNTEDRYPTGMFSAYKRRQLRRWIGGKRP